MNWRETIRDLMTDEDGNYKLGIEHQITVDRVCEQMGYPGAVPADRTYQIAQTHINAVCAQIRREGYAAGGLGRAPTHYIIAKNDAEARLIVANQARQNIGRLSAYLQNGRRVVRNTRLAQATIKQLAAFIEDDGPLPEQPELDMAQDRNN